MPWFQSWYQACERRPGRETISYLKESGTQQHMELLKLAGFTDLGFKKSQQ